MKALFLDRDGVINDNKRPVNKPKDLKLYDGVKESLQKAQQAGYELFVVTNQGGIELGYLSHDRLKKIHDEMSNMLSGFCEFKDIEYCPDYKKQSKFRKPQPGMLLKLRDKYNVEMSKSWMIGDMDTDIEAGVKAGCKTAKIGSRCDKADIHGKDLRDVINQILDK